MQVVSVPHLIADIQRSGFHILDLLEDMPLTELAAQLGDAVPSAPGRQLTDLLTPQAREHSLAGTLSSIHGVEAFPFHTETAYWRHPIDWVILKCINPGTGYRKTLLIDGWRLRLGNDEVKALEDSLMVVKNGSRSFLASAVERRGGKLFFRYDLGCMKRACTAAASAVNILKKRVEEARYEEVQWKPGRHVIFDNHRMLHSRAKSYVPDADRKIERVYVVKQRK